MTIKNYAIICPAMLFLGIILFAYHKEIIILNFGHPLITKTLQPISQKKNCAFFYWHNDAWHSDTVQLIFSDNSAINVQQVISHWLQFIHEEKIIRKKVALQAATISFNHQELLISLDRLPWNKESSTFDKLMNIEALLKTIKQAEPTIKRVRFLMNHQPMDDGHLDFINSWPVDGFNK